MDSSTIRSIVLVELFCIGPLLLLAYELGAQSAARWSLNATLWRGLVTSWHLAWTRGTPNDTLESLTDAPKANVGVAVMLGIAWAHVPALFFLTPIAAFRTRAGVIWILGTSLIFGIGGYCRRRGAAYLKNVSGIWNISREWSLLNPSRYAPEGRRYAYAQIVCGVLLFLWCLGGIKRVL
jgi:hypothetical protein